MECLGVSETTEADVWLFEFDSVDVNSGKIVRLDDPEGLDNGGIVLDTTDTCDDLRHIVLRRRENEAARLCNSNCEQTTLSNVNEFFPWVDELMLDAFVCEQIDMLSSSSL